MIYFQRTKTKKEDEVFVFQSGLRAKPWETLTFRVFGGRKIKKEGGEKCKQGKKKNKKAR